MSIFLQNYVMLTQGATDKVFPHLFSTGGFTLFGATATYLQTVIILFSLVLMVSLHLFIRRTRMGKAMRATAQDRIMASLVGINVDTVIIVTFVIGSGLAAVAGIMVAMYYGLVNYSIGYMAGIKAFTAAVLGASAHPGCNVRGYCSDLSSLGAVTYPQVQDAYALWCLCHTVLDLAYSKK